MCVGGGGGGGRGRGRREYSFFFFHFFMEKCVCSNARKQVERLTNPKVHAACTLIRKQDVSVACRQARRLSEMQTT